MKRGLFTRFYFLLIFAYAVSAHATIDRILPKEWHIFNTATITEASQQVHVSSMMRRRHAPAIKTYTLDPPSYDIVQSQVPGHCIASSSAFESGEIFTPDHTFSSGNHSPPQF